MPQTGMIGQTKTAAPKDSRNLLFLHQSANNVLLDLLKEIGSVISVSFKFNRL